MPRAEATHELLTAGKLWLPAVLELEARHQGHAEHVLAELSVARSAFDDPRGQLPLSVAERLLRLATRRTKDLAFVLAAGRNHAGASSDLFLRMLVAQADFQTARSMARRFAPLTIEGLGLTYLHEGDGLRVVPSLLGAPFEEALVSEYLVALSTRLTDDAAIAGLRVTDVEFVHAARLPLERYEAWLGARVHFDRARVAMVFPSANFALRDADPLLARLLTDHAQQVLAARPARKGVRARVEVWLRPRLGETSLGVDDAAAHLGVSGRTLRRRLELEDTTFGDVLDALRRERALELLDDSSHPVTDVAMSVGFSSSGAFRRAFLRWTGTNASSYRAAHAARGHDGARE